MAGLEGKSEFDSSEISRRNALGLFGGMLLTAAGCGDPDQPNPSLLVSSGPPGTINPGHPSPETDAHTPDASDASPFSDSSVPDTITDDFGHRAIDATRGEDGHLPPPEDANPPSDDGQLSPDEGQPPEDVSEDVPAEEDIPPVDPDDGVPTDPGQPPEDVSEDVPAEEDIPPVDPDDGVPADEGQPVPDEGQPAPDEGKPPEDVETFAPMEVIVTAEGNNLNNDNEVLLANFWIEVATQDSGKISNLTFNITPENWPQFYGVNVYLADENYKPLTPFQTIGKPGDNDKVLTVSFQLPQTPVQKGKTLIKVMLKSLTSIPKAQDTLMQITTNLVAAEIASDKGSNQAVQTKLDNAIAVSTNQFNT